MSKGEEEQAGERTSRRKNMQTGRASNRKKRKKTENVDCHQCQRGRLLEILSLMAKEVALKQKQTKKAALKQRKAKEAQ